jgi:hypothetical protein
VSFNGAADVTITSTLANSGVVAGTYSALAVDAKGRVTTGINITATGDATGTASGSSIALTLATSGVTAGTYSFSTIVVDAKGRVTSASSATPTTSLEKLDNISASFNGSTTTFNLRVSAVAVTPLTANHLMISINGVMQEPTTAYTVSGSTITFTGAPPTGSTFYGVHIATISVGSLTAPTNGFRRNKIINGGMQIDQRNAGASQTFTAAAALAYSVDRWYGYCTGANVTGQRVAGSSINQYRYQFTGAASVTAIGFGQRIEAINSYDLNNSTAIFSVDLANSLLTTVTWTAYYANTADTFGSLASPTRTQIATGTFTVTSTVTNYTASISIPSAATTGIEIVFTVGAQTSGTWTIGNVQLEAGSLATPFERLPIGETLMLCQRYFFKDATPGVAPYGAGSPAVMTFTMSLPVTMRVSPTVAVTTAPTLTNCIGYSVGANSPSSIGHSVTITGAAGQYAISSNGFYTASAEL